MTNRFEVWAPNPSEMELVLIQPGTLVGANVAECGDAVRIPMVKADNDWWHPDSLDDIYTTGEWDYGYVIDGTGPFPDPTARNQPYGVHGLSRTFDPSAHQWQDESWTGRQLAGGVIYELHVGTFSTDGTLTGAIAHLDHLVDLGVDFVELMPVNAFNGPRGWGYDGVHWYAVHHDYGGPRAYQEFVDACHQRGLGVIQDVVYNHLGPSGNYLPMYGPYLNDAVQSGWGSAINLDAENSDEVRAYIINNALMWCRDYHVDGLRLDAVHALVDTTAIHILEEIAVEIASLSTFLGKPLVLIAESDLNNPRIITPREGGGYGIDAQWSDDFHHALLANLTGQAPGYYADFASMDALGKVIESGFFHDGTLSSFRGRRHGRRLDIPNTPTWRLVVFSDNHDQIGNRARGERLSEMVSPRQQALAAMATLLSGFTPMIFQGEEWGATTPFQFFTSHPEPDLARAVTQGRFDEFAKMEWGDVDVPDPQDEQTFLRSKLDWTELKSGVHEDLLTVYRNLIQLRRDWPDLVDPRFDMSSVRFDPDQQWFVIERGEKMAVVINFADESSFVPFTEDVDVIFELGMVDPDPDGGIWLGGHSGAVVLYRLEDIPVGGAIRE